MTKTNEEGKEADFWVVACGGCHQSIGFTSDKNPTRSKIYCSEICVADLAVVEMSERQDMWDFLNTRGFSPVAISRYGDHPMRWSTERWTGYGHRFQLNSLGC